MSPPEAGTLIRDKHHIVIIGLQADPAHTDLMMRCENAINGTQAFLFQHRYDERAETVQWDLTKPLPDAPGYIILFIPDNLPNRIKLISLLPMKGFLRGINAASGEALESPILQLAPPAGVKMPPYAQMLSLLQESQ